MLPILFQIGPIPIHTYGLLIAIGFLLAMSLVGKFAKRAGLPADPVIDLAFMMLLVGFIGARVLFAFTQLSTFVSDPIAIFRVWEGGLVFYGGPLAAIPFGIWRLRKLGIPVWRALDVYAPGLALAHMFGRFGCIAAGCCYGKPTGTSFGFRFHSEVVDPSLWDIPLHPTQAYEASGLFILFLVLARLQKTKRFDGHVALTYLLAYPLLRSVVEIFRGDLVRGFVIDGVLSTSQFLSLLVFLAAFMMLVLRLRALKPGRALNLE